MPSLNEMTREVKKSAKVARQEKAVPRVHPSIFKSSEKVIGSDLESESEIETDSKSETKPTKIATPASKVNQKFRREASSGTSNTKTEGKISTSEDDSRSSSGSGSESDSGRESSNDSEREVSEVMRPETADEGSEKITMQNQKMPLSSFTRAVALYCPPCGFKKGSAKSGGQPKASQVFNSENLAGKQIWYITVPASVPITSVKQVSLQDVQLGKPALSLNGHDYGFVQDQNENRSYTKFMVPDDAGKSYRIDKRAIDHTLHLQKIVQLPNLQQQNDSQGKVAHLFPIPAKKRIRKQPEGLIMRFHPIGSGTKETGVIGLSSSLGGMSSSTESDDEELKDAPPKIKLPLTLKIEHLATKNSLLEPAEKKGESSNSSKKTKVDPAPVKEYAESSKSDTTRGSNTSSEDLDDEDDAHLRANNPHQRSLKRKLSNIEDHQAASNPRNKSTSNMPKQLPLGKMNTPKSTMPPPTSSPSRHAVSALPSLPQRSTPILPPRFTIPSSKESSSPAAFKVPNKERQGTIVPPILPKRIERSLTSLEMAPNKIAQSEAKPKSLLEIEKGTSLEERIRAIDPGLNEEQRRKEIKRLRKNEQSRMSHARRRGFGMGEDPSAALLGVALAADSRGRSFVIKPPPRVPSTHKVPHQGMNMNITPDINAPPSSTLKPKKPNKTVLGAAVEEHGKASIKSQKAPPLSPPQKVLAILPPGTRTSVLK